jgi:hypothetical protein
LQSAWAPPAIAFGVILPETRVNTNYFLSIGIFFFPFHYSTPPHRGNRSATVKPAVFHADAQQADAGHNLRQEILIARSPPLSETIQTPIRDSGSLSARPRWAQSQLRSSYLFGRKDLAVDPAGMPLLE